MCNGDDDIPLQPAPPHITQPTFQDLRRQIRVVIVEQPHGKIHRFRYKCEGRSAGSIQGASSTPENKTFPSIKVVGYQGKARVVVSCVTKDEPYRAHPHSLVGKEGGCNKGVCSLPIPTDTMTVQFSNLGIQCARRQDVETALTLRELIKVDPFGQSFDHRNKRNSIDLNVVRLCFQVFLDTDTPGKYIPLRPVVSQEIYDSKSVSNLAITKLSECVSYVDGGRKDIILLCEKVTKEDIQVRFFEEINGQLVWEDFADIQPSQVHKQHAIWFRTPKYRRLDVTEPVKVFIQLRQPSNQATGPPLPFELLPRDSVTLSEKAKRKRAKIGDPNEILRFLQKHDNQMQHQLDILMNTTKSEPRDSSLPYVGPMYNGISPSYVRSPSLSPQYSLHPDSIASSPSPDHIRYQYHNNDLSVMTNVVSPQNWNMPTSPEMNLPSSSGMNLLSVSGMNLPPASRMNLPSISEISFPSTSGMNLPSISGMSLPSISGMNFPSTTRMNLSSSRSGKNTPSTTVLNHVDNNIHDPFLDLDTTQVNSAELNDCLNMIGNGNQLPEINSLSLGDINVPSQDENMSYSLTLLDNNTDIYRPPH